MRLHVIDRVNIAQHSRVVGRRFGTPLPFVVRKDERLVFPDRSTDGAAKLILAQHVEARRGENTHRIEFVVAEVVVQRTVHVVGAALRDDVHDASSGAAEFRRVVGVDDAKLLHRLLRRRAALDARGGRNIVGAVDGDEIEVNVLAGEGKLGDRLDDDVGAARGRVADGDARARARRNR